MDLISRVRYCGNCNLCCLVLEVPELNKKAGEWCKHCTAEGCSIYEDRPEVCQGFHCLWQLMDKSEDKKGVLRPDRLGVVMIHKEELDGYSPAVQFNAPDKNKLYSPKVQAIANAIVNGGKCVGLVSVKGDIQDKLLIPKNISRGF